jgi:hypothetical protein
MSDVQVRVPRRALQMVSQAERAIVANYSYTDLGAEGERWRYGTCAELRIHVKQKVRIV